MSEEAKMNSMKNQEIRDVEASGFELEIKNSIFFVSRNLHTLFLFGFLGFCLGLWLATSNKVLGPGALFHNYELQVDLNEDNQFPDGIDKFYQNSQLSFDDYSIRIVKPQVITEMAGFLPKDIEAAVNATFVENTSRVLLHVSSSAPIDEHVLKDAAKLAFEKAFAYLDAIQTVNETRAKEALLSLQSDLFLLYEKQYQILQTLKVKLPDINFEEIEGDSILGLPQLAMVLNHSQISSTEKQRVQSEYYEVQFQARRVLSNYRNFEKSSLYSSIVDRSYIHYRADQVDIRNTSSKGISRRIVICLSGIFAGIVFGILFAMIKERLLAFRIWIKQLKR